MKKTLIYILVITIFAILLFTYFNRGGLVKPQLSKVQTQPFTMLGKSYKGFGKDKAIRELIRQTHEYMNNGTLKGSLSIIYRGNPDAKNNSKTDSIEVFVGVIIDDTINIKAPKYYEIKNYPAMKTVRAEIKAHVTVAPNPESINKTLLEFARKSGLEIDNVYIERYLSEEHIISEIKVK
jgi:hypothetical protein